MNESPRPRGRVRMRETQQSRYDLAGAAADELIAILGGNAERDRGTWAFYCYHHDPEILLDKAHECASRARQGELRNAVSAFQHWLSRSFPEGGAR